MSTQQDYLALNTIDSIKKINLTDGNFNINTTSLYKPNSLLKGSTTTPKPSMFKSLGGVGGIGGMVGDLGSSLIPTDPNKDATTAGLDSAYDTAANAAMAIPGWGTIVGGAMKLGGFASDGLNKLTGGKTTINDPGTTSDKILSSKFLSLSPIGLANSLTKEKVEGSNENLAEDVNLGYGAESAVGGKEFGGVTSLVSDWGSKLFGKKDGVQAKKDKIKLRANDANRLNYLKGSAIQESKTEKLASMNSTQDAVSKNKQALSGGLQGIKILSAQRGTKLQLKNIVDKVTKTEPQKLAKGGKVNVIPEGALHARKHNLEMDDITKKGIPVISYEEGDKIEQHAEIEKDEVILHIELTKKLEKLRSKYEESDKEEFAIEAGKLLSEELLENTKDNTGLLNIVE